ncbi:MAG: hypothetical protein KJ729_01745, partial [Euryarchaeota archaeon]|nr:hypothetical protein [Euryarchaeota archaeon]
MEINKQTLIVIKDAIREALINEDLDLLRGIQMLENTIWTHAAVGKSVIKYLWTKKEQGVDHVSRRELAKAYKHISKYMLFEKFLEENEFITVDYENNSVSLSKHWDWLFDRPDRNELVNPERLGKMITSECVKTQLLSQPQIPNSTDNRFIYSEKQLFHSF